MRFLYFFLLCFSLKVASTTAAICNVDQYYVIRNQESGMVLEDVSGLVLIEYFDGYDPQLWQFQCTGQPGTYYIVNRDTRNFLDIDRNTDHCITNEPDGSLYQQWFVNSDGTLANAGTGLKLDVYDSGYEPGNYLQVHKDNGTGAQMFVLQEKND